MKRDSNKTVGYGYVGRWQDKVIGWALPSYIHPYNRRGLAEQPSQLFHENAQPDDRAVLCRITVEVVKDKLGREITRRPRKKVTG